MAGCASADRQRLQGEMMNGKVNRQNMLSVNLGSFSEFSFL